MNLKNSATLVPLDDVKSPQPPNLDRNNPKRRHTYLLVTNHNPYTLDDFTGHLKSVIGRNMRLTVLYPGCYRVTTDRIVTRSDLGLLNLTIGLWSEIETKQLQRPELIFYSSVKITIQDLVKAGIVGITGLRKWSPNRVTKRPNSGYTAYFFNEDFAAYAYSKESILLKDSATIMFKVNAPPPAMLPDNMPKDLFLKTRDAQLTSHRNLLTEHWKHGVHVNFEAIVPLQPEPSVSISEEAREQLLELKADHDGIKQQLSLMQAQLTQNTNTLNLHTEKLDKHEKQLELIQVLDDKVTAHQDMTLEILSLLKAQQNKPAAEYERPKSYQQHYSDEVISGYEPQNLSTPTHALNRPVLPESD